MRVDLPAPFSPTRTRTSPARTSRCTSLSDWTPGNPLLMHSTLRMGSLTCLTCFLEGSCSLLLRCCVHPMGLNIGSILTLRGLPRKLYLNVSNEVREGKTCNNNLVTASPPERSG